MLIASLQCMAAHGFQIFLFRQRFVGHMAFEHAAVIAELF
jgi:hypothetical protein